jgi:hypothetical protein
MSDPKSNSKSDSEPDNSKSDHSRPDNSKSENPKSAKPKSQNPESRESSMPAMAGLAIAVVLLVVGLWLAHELRAASKMQDCVMSGRTNCNQIQP